MTEEFHFFIQVLQVLQVSQVLQFLLFKQTCKTCMTCMTGMTYKLHNCIMYYSIPSSCIFSKSLSYFLSSSILTYRKASLVP